MKKTFIFLAIGAFALNLSAQEISQNVTPNVVSASGSVACGANDGTYTGENNYARVFDLSTYGINYQYKITKIAFGVQNANKPLTVGVNVYQSIGDFPFGQTFLLGNYSVPVTPADVGKMVSTDSGASGTTLPANSKFVVEVSHSGQSTLESFYLGTNPNGQTGPSYLSSATCGITTPTATGTGALAAFGSAQWVMTITGVNNLGVTEIINAETLKIYPNPVKEVLNFHLGNNLKVESVELIDMQGKQLKNLSAKNSSGINVSYLPAGTYILKVKASDGNVYVQKVLKK